MSGFPFPIKVCAIDLGVAIVASYVGAERGRNAGNYRLGIGNIERGGNARDVNQIARSPQIAIERFAAVKAIYASFGFTWIAEAECRAAPTVKYARDASV